METNYLLGIAFKDLGEAAWLMCNDCNAAARGKLLDVVRNLETLLTTMSEKKPG